MEKVIREKLINEANALARRIGEHRRPNSLLLPLFSDLHAQSAEDGIVELIAEALGDTVRATEADAVINLGDNLAMLGRMYHITNESLKETLTAVLDRIDEAFECPMLAVNGNHDGVGTDFYLPELWRGIVKDKYHPGVADYDSTGGYFYTDFEKASVRLVFLSLPSGSDLTAEHPTPLWRFGEDQLRWLSDTALDTELDVLLFCHVPIWYESNESTETLLGTWNGERATLSTIRALCGWIEDRDRAAQIINTSGRVKACFSGHIHTASLRMPYEELDGIKNPLACPQYVTVRPATPCDENTAGFGFDVILYTPGEKAIHLFRFGDGEDTVISLD